MKSPRPTRHLLLEEHTAALSSPSEQTCVLVGIRQEPEAAGLPFPAYATRGAAGMDLMAALPDDAPKTLQPGERALISTGLRIALPEGYEAQVRPRSGLAIRNGIALVNAPGTIDSDFRGVIHVILVNLSSEPVTFRRGDRIAQMVIAPVVRAAWMPLETLDETVRGEGGFGSTGVGA